MKDVIISIKGTQRDRDGKPAVIELETDGRYAYRDGRAELDYMESLATGMDGTHTAIAVTPEGVTITRDGAVNMKTMFIMGEKNLFMYRTPYGAVSMGVDTRLVRSTLGEHGGGLEIRYNVDSDNALISRNALEINVRDMQ